MDQEAQARARKRKLAAAEKEADSADTEELDNVSSELPRVSLADFIDSAVAGAKGSNLKYIAHVECGAHVVKDDVGDRVREVAAIIGNHMQLHWRCALLISSSARY